VEDVAKWVPDFMVKFRVCLYCGEILLPGEIALTKGNYWAKKRTDEHEHRWVLTVNTHSPITPAFL